jgi:hypothetical protein
MSAALSEKISPRALRVVHTFSGSKLAFSTSTGTLSMFLIDVNACQIQLSVAGLPHYSTKVFFGFAKKVNDLGML